MMSGNVHSHYKKNKQPRLSGYISQFHAIRWDKSLLDYKITRTTAGVYDRKSPQHNRRREPKEK